MGLRFTVTETEEGDWIVRDEDGIVFRGSLDACRDWLDLEEARSRRSWFQRMRDWFRPKRDT